MNENEVALRAFDVHGLLLVLKGDVLSEVGPAEERVAAEVADEVFGHRQAHLVPLVHLLMPASMYKCALHSVPFYFLRVYQLTSLDCFSWGTPSHKDSKTHPFQI